MAEQPKLDFTKHSLNVNKLGFYLDGWGELIEGMGGKAQEVQISVHKFLTEREMPDIEVRTATGIVGLLSRAKREYTITTTHPGATTTAFIGDHGKDLFVAWHTYIRPIPNWKVLGWMTLVAAALSLCPSFAFFSNGIAAAGSEFIREFNLISIPTVIILSASCFFSNFFGVFVVESFLLLLAGYFAKGNPIAYFFVEPNVFDADDIAAMSLSVHKSILRALDKVGIDSALLRQKVGFYQKRGEAL